MLLQCRRRGCDTATGGKEIWQWLMEGPHVAMRGCAVLRMSHIRTIYNDTEAADAGIIRRHGMNGRKGPRSEGCKCTYKVRQHGII